MALNNQATILECLRKMSNTSLVPPNTPIPGVNSLFDLPPFTAFPPFNPPMPCAATESSLVNDASLHSITQLLCPPQMQSNPPTFPVTRHVPDEQNQADNVLHSPVVVSSGSSLPSSVAVSASSTLLSPSASRISHTGASEEEAGNILPHPRPRSFPTETVVEELYRSRTKYNFCVRLLSLLYSKDDLKDCSVNGGHGKRALNNAAKTFLRETFFAYYPAANKEEQESEWRKCTNAMNAHLCKYIKKQK